MNRTNLTKLSTYLAALPIGYDHFNMDHYFVDGNRKTADTPVTIAEVVPSACGAVACAVGHGPAAGIPISPKHTSWNVYSETVFDMATDTLEWEWCFSDIWSEYDNTPQGAAHRINWLLQYGEPPGDFATEADNLGENESLHEILSAYGEGTWDS